jgi:hypothetical protein
MSTRTVLADLREKKRNIDRAIRALESLQRMERDRASAEQEMDAGLSEAKSNIVMFPRSDRRA